MIIYSALGGSAAAFGQPIVGGLCVHGGTDCCRAPHSFTKKRVYVLRYLSFVIMTSEAMICQRLCNDYLVLEATLSCSRIRFMRIETGMQSSYIAT